jgi:zinc transporter
MNVAIDPHASSVAPGLAFACVLDGKGGCKAVDWDGVRGWRPSDGVLWVHLERLEPASKWLRQESAIDPLICDALLAEESRPRVEDIGDGLLAVLRGVNRTMAGEPLELLPLHVWVDADRLVSMREAGKTLGPVREVRDALLAGYGATTVGRLLVKLAQKSVKYVEEVVGELDEEVDRLDDDLEQLSSKHGREALGDLRRRALHLRRYLAPQREALFRLQGEDMTWLERRDRIHLREAADKLLRYVETLDAVRDRATILHEDLTALTAEQIARTSNRFTAIAGLLLPPTLVAGLLGANVGGIPGSTDPIAFYVVVAIVVLMFPLEVLILKKLGWV